MPQIGSESINPVYVYIEIASQLKGPGDTVERSGVLALDHLDLADKTFAFPHEIPYTVALTHTGEGILLTGMVKTEAHTECDRCLEDTVVAVAGEVEGYFLFEEPEEHLSDEEEEYQLIEDAEQIDVAPNIIAAALIELPLVTLCDEDCLGICPTCGVNRNLEPCECHTEDAIDSSNPFSVLAGLDLNKDTP